MTPRPRAVELFNLDPELEHLDDDQWYERRDEINRDIAAVLVNRSTDEWLSEFAERDVWASPLLELDDAVDHPQVEANDFIETISLGPGRGEARAVGLVTQVGSATTAERLPPPLLGEHNEIVAQALGGADA
jgi:crotonobetainyl-CoA:carnitine CoA-transferase CaiB-like acyl-CoA transferase